MSRKHNRWDRRWLNSSAQIEWQNVAQMIKSRGRAGVRGEMESLCFPSCTLSSVHDGKHFYFTHQSVTSCRLHRCHHCAIKHKSLKSSAKSPEWMCVAERCHLSQVLWQGGLKKMQITYHTPHTSLKLIFSFFPPVSLSSPTGLCFKELKTQWPWQRSPSPLPQSHQ